MMTQEIEKQLIEWGGNKRPEGLVSFLDPRNLSLQFFDDGSITFSGIFLSNAWKTIDDIVNVLDVFGVKRKQPPKWTSDGSFVFCKGDKRAVFYGTDAWNPTAAAAEYAAMMNAKEE